MSIISKETIFTRWVNIYNNKTFIARDEGGDYKKYLEQGHPVMKHAIRKYGFGGFRVFYLITCGTTRRYDLDILEKLFVEKYNSNVSGKCGYNIDPSYTIYIKPKRNYDHIIYLCFILILSYVLYVTSNPRDIFTIYYDRKNNVSIMTYIRSLFITD